MKRPSRGIIAIVLCVTALTPRVEGVLPEEREQPTAVENPWLLLKRRADQGDPGSMLFLALAHIDSSSRRGPALYPPYWVAESERELWHLSNTALSIPELSDEAESGTQLLEKAASLAHPEALIQLGIRLSIKPEGELRAKELFLRAANEIKYPRGLAYLGWCYEQGRGGAKDVLKAWELYEQGVAAGDAQSMVLLAGLYETGVGVARNPRKALALYKDAANKNSPEANRRIGDVVLSEIIERSRRFDLPTWTAFFGEAEPSPLNPFYDMYKILSTPRDKGAEYRHGVRLAAHLYRRAAALGDPDAMWSLGNLFAGTTLSGTPKGIIFSPTEFERSEGLYWYYSLARAGAPEAFYVLASRTENGFPPLLKDERKAVLLYARAAVLGLQNAQQVLRNRSIDWKPLELPNDDALLSQVAEASKASLVQTSKDASDLDTALAALPAVRDGRDTLLLAKRVAVLAARVEQARVSLHTDRAFKEVSAFLRAYPIAFDWQELSDSLESTKASVAKALFEIRRFADPPTGIVGWSELKQELAERTNTTQDRLDTLEREVTTALGVAQRCSEAAKLAGNRTRSLRNHPVHTALRHRYALVPVSEAKSRWTWPLTSLHAVYSNYDYWKAWISSKDWYEGRGSRLLIGREHFTEYEWLYSRERAYQERFLEFRRFLREIAGDPENMEVELRRISLPGADARGPVVDKLAPYFLTAEDASRLEAAPPPPVIECKTTVEVIQRDLEASQPKARGNVRRGGRQRG